MPGNSSQPAGNTTTTVSNDPWSGVQPYLQQAFGQATQLYNQGGPAYFPNSTVTPFSQNQQQGMNQIAQRAQAGSPLLQAGQQGLLNTIQGNTPGNPAAGAGGAQGGPGAFTGGQQSPFLGQQGQNPHLQDMLRIGQDSIRNQISGQFAQGGRFGPGAMVAEQGRALGDFTSQFLGSQYQQDQNRRFGAQEGMLGRQFQGGQAGLGRQFGAFENERGRQMGAIGQAPWMAQQDFNDPMRLLGVGGMQRGLGQEQMQDAVGRFNFGQNAPYQNLNQYLAQLGQAGQFGQQQTTQPFFQNQGAGLLGGALGGAGIGSMLGLSNPWMAGLAGAGGLLGGFG